jgi:hypothetical protein
MNTDELERYIKQIDERLDREAYTETHLTWTLSYEIEINIKKDGRCIADIPNLPGVTAYGLTEEEAIKTVKLLALRVIADQIKHDEMSAV